MKLSCNQCKSRKVKCDKRLPECSNCRRRNQACKYPTTFRSIPVVSSSKVSKRVDIKQNNRSHAEVRVAVRSENSNRYYGALSSKAISQEAGREFVNHDSYFSEPFQNFPCLFGENSIKETQDIILKGLELYRWTEEVKAGESVDFAEFSDEVRSSLETLRFPSKTLVQILSMLIVSSRFNPEINEEALSNLLSAFGRVSLFAEDSVELIKSKLLLLDHYYYSFKIESAWCLLFNIVCSSFTIGLHVSNEKDSRSLWNLVALYDSLICSSVGRPTAISTYLPAENTLFTRMIVVLRRACSAFQSCQTSIDNYDTEIVGLDEQLTKVEQEASKSAMSHIQVCYYRLILLTEQIKVHYLFIRNKDFSRYRINKLFLEFFEAVKEFWDSCSEIKRHEYVVHTHKIFSFGSCFVVQTLSILLATMRKFSSIIDREVLNSYVTVSASAAKHSKFVHDERQLHDVLEKLDKATESDLPPQTNNTPPGAEVQNGFFTDDPFFYELLFGEVNSQ